MFRGKTTCKILKDIRKQIAANNDIAFITSECKYQGDCTGTCPKCEAELRYLEEELHKRRQLGKAVAITGISLGLAATFTSCGNADETRGEHPLKPASSAQTEQTASAKAQTSTRSQKSSRTASNDQEPVGSENPSCEKKCSSNGLDLGGDILFGEDAIEGDIPPIGLIDEVPERVIQREEDISFFFDKHPEFPGGREAMMDFISKEIKYPEIAKKNGIGGVVLVECVVEKDGSIQKARVMVSLFEDCDKEAIRVVQAMPKWKPAEKAGETVRCYYQVPVFFKL